MGVGDQIRDLFDSRNSFCKTNFSNGKFLAAAVIF